MDLPALRTIPFFHGIRLNEHSVFCVMCLSFYKLSADSYAESKQCVPNDTNITSTGHSCNHPPTHPPHAHFLPALPESHGLPLVWGSGPWTTTSTPLGTERRLLSLKIILYRGPGLGSSESASMTSYLSSVETIALNCLVFFLENRVLCMRFSRQTDGQTDKHWTASLHKASTFASTGSVRLYLKDGMFIFCVQVFYELLQLIKADKKRCQNPPESDTKSTAINSTKRSSTTRRNGGVKSVPEGQNSTKRAEKKTNKKCKKRFGRRHDFRRRVRNIRRTVRRVWRRIATCSVM